MTPVGADRFTFDASRPTTPGMQLALSEFFPVTDKLSVSLRTEQPIVDCTVPSQTTSTPKPGPDTTAPTATLGGFTTRALKRLGLRRLLKRGLPISVTVSEPSKVTARLSLVKGRKRNKLLTATKAVNPGRTAFTVRLPRRVKATLAKAGRRAKLRIALTVTDQAGNQKVLPPVTVRLPRN